VIDVYAKFTAGRVSKKITFPHQKFIKKKVTLMFAGKKSPRQIAFLFLFVS
jgi:hypothetical protein